MKTKKLERTVKKFLSAELLLKEDMLLDATSLFWQATRDCIFNWLTEKNVEFDSTDSAIQKVIKMLDANARSKVLQLETIGTLAEWDEFFVISYVQTQDYKNTCLQVINILGYGIN